MTVSIEFEQILRQRVMADFSFEDVSFSFVYLNYEPSPLAVKGSVEEIFVFPLYGADGECSMGFCLHNLEVVAQNHFLQGLQQLLMVRRVRPQEKAAFIYSLAESEALSVYVL